MRFIPFILAALLAAPICAQVFPKTDKDNVGSDIEKAKKGGEQPVKPDDPPKKPDDPPKAVDGAAALKKFNELRESLHKAEGPESRESDKVLNQLNEMVGPYIAAQVTLKQGFYKEATKQFKKLNVPSDEEVSKLSGGAKEKAKELQRGLHYFYRAFAEVMAAYTYTDNDADYERMWTRAEKQGQNVAKELKSAVDRKQIDETLGGFTLRRIESWLGEEKTFWNRLRAAEKALIDKPDDLAAWQAYLSCVSAREDQTPDLLSARAVLLVLKEFWASDKVVTGGNVDAGLAWLHTAACQFERANAALETSESLSEAGKKYLEEQKKRIVESQNTILRELKK